MGTVLAMILNKQSTFEKTSYHKHFTIRASKNTDMRLVTSQLFTLFQICDYVRRSSLRLVVPMVIECANIFNSRAAAPNPCVLDFKTTHLKQLNDI